MQDGRFERSDGRRKVAAVTTLGTLAVLTAVVFLSRDRTPAPPSSPPAASPTAVSAPVESPRPLSAPESKLPAPPRERSTPTATPTSPRPSSVRPRREPIPPKLQGETIRASPPAVSAGPELSPAPGPPTVLPVPNLMAEAPGAELEPESRAVNRVLDRYRQVYNRLDARGARSIWPSVDAEALARIFTRLERQTMTFDDCSIALSESTATAHCAGLLEYVPRVGSAKLHTERHSWTIELRRASEGWQIVKVSGR